MFQFRTTTTQNLKYLESSNPTCGETHHHVAPFLIIQKPHPPKQESGSSLDVCCKEVRWQRHLEKRWPLKMRGEGGGWDWFRDPTNTFSPGLNGGRPLKGHVAHRKASPSPHCKMQLSEQNKQNRTNSKHTLKSILISKLKDIHCHIATWNCSNLPSSLTSPLSALLQPSHKCNFYKLSLRFQLHNHQLHKYIAQCMVTKITKIAVNPERIS